MTDIGINRRSLMKFTGAGIVALSAASALTTQARSQEGAEWDKTFPKSETVDHEKVTFKNRYGINLSGDLYLPKERGENSLSAIAVAGPFGAVKEQSAGLYAQTMAERGFATLAFDPSYTGESGGEPRNVASPDIFTEDFSAAVDFLGLHEAVDREHIGAIGICGLSGMALTAATSDTRIKAIATASMYDMSRSMSRSHQDSYTPEQRQKVIEYLSQKRWQDAENGTFSLGLHEVPFDESDNIIEGQNILPDTLPDNPDPVLVAFHSYYKNDRGFHPRSINSTTAWTATTPMAFFNFPMHNNLKLTSPRPILLMAGANAHSLYYSETVIEAASEPKELLVVPDADHVDLYDQMDKIPFDRLAAFFETHLA